MGEKDRMRPTQMLLVRLSLREFQELDTSAQALQSQHGLTMYSVDFRRRPSRKSEPD